MGPLRRYDVGKTTLKLADAHARRLGLLAPAESEDAGGPTIVSSSTAAAQPRRRRALAPDEARAEAGIPPVEGEDEPDRSTAPATKKRPTPRPG